MSAQHVAAGRKSAETYAEGWHVAASPTATADVIVEIRRRLGGDWSCPCCGQVTTHWTGCDGARP